MAKELSAERVSPITRANYTGHGGAQVRDENYDPLAALANLVGNIEQDVAPGPENEPEFSDLESGLVENIQAAEHPSVVEKVAQSATPPATSADLNTMEQELSMALNSAEQPSAPPAIPIDLTPFGKTMPPPSEPVLQSFAALHSAFDNAQQSAGNAEPLPGDPSTAPEVVYSDDVESTIKEQMLQELGINSSPATQVPPAPPMQVDDDVAATPETPELFAIPARDEYQQSAAERPINTQAFASFATMLNQQSGASGQVEPAGSGAAEPDNSEAAIGEPALPEQFEHTAEPVSAEAPPEAYAAPVEPNGYQQQFIDPQIGAGDIVPPMPDEMTYADQVYQTNEFEQEVPQSVAEEAAPAPYSVNVDAQDALVEESFSADFEAAMAGSAAEILSVSDNYGVAEEPAPAYPDEAAAPFGTLADAVTMPPVTTPFDGQVDTALNEMLESEQQNDAELGWSGDLAGELAQIVSASPEGQNYIDNGQPQEVANLAGGDPAIAAAPINEMPQDLPPMPVEDRVDISAFEQDLADQLEPVAIDDPYMAIPDTPEVAGEIEKKRGGLGVTIGVLGVAGVVAAVAFGWNYFSSGPSDGSTQIIMASGDPVKIKPAEPGGEKIPNQNQVVFEEVNGGEAAKTGQERLASGTEAPIRVISTDAVAPVVQALPVTKSPRTIAKSAARIAPDDTVLVRTEQAVVSPRKVRTVTVRPDGTIVVAKQVKKPAVKPASPINTRAVKVAPIGGNSAKPATGKTVAAPKNITGQSTAPVVAALPVRTVKPVTKPLVPVRTIKVAPVKSVATSGQNSGAIAAPAKTRTPAATPVKVQPIKKAVPRKAIKKATPKPVRTAAVSAGSYVMQISSQRSAEAAQSSYNRLSRRFPGILGGKGVDIRRSTIKDKGVFYRVRVPVGSKRAAINLCTRYKSAGGSCFVTR